MSNSFSFVPRPHSIAHRVAISISAEHRLPLVVASMECAAIMPLGQRLQIGLVNFYVPNLFCRQLRFRCGLKSRNWLLTIVCGAVL